MERNGFFPTKEEIEEFFQEKGKSVSYGTISISGNFEYGKAISGYNGISVVNPHPGVAMTKSHGISIVKDGSMAVSGDAGISISQYKGISISKEEGIAFAGVEGIASAGDDGVIMLLYYDKNKNGRYRVIVGYVGENGIEANKKYKLNDNNEFVEEVDFDK